MHGYVIVTGTKEQAREITNRLAPEHLTVDSEEDLAWVQHAGSVFIGNWSSQPMGDYISGPNHTLPTGGVARVRGGLSVKDFVKLVTVQEYTAEGVRALGPAAVALAKAEGLSGHAAAVRTRDWPVPERVAVRARAASGRSRMKEYHPPLGGRDGLRLDFNENTLACSPRVIEVLRNITAADLTRYPERGSVEAVVAASLHVEAAQVLLTNGVDEAIHVLCQAFLDRGDAMLLPVPTYTMYEVYGSAAEARIDAVLAGDGFRFPLDAMLSAIHPRTRLIAIANPNSPTGATATREQIVAIAERAPHAVVLVDEAYYHFFGETVIDLVGKLPNLVVARTFSKAYGLAGLRLGVLVAAEETDAVAAASDFALQRESACACMPACGAGRSSLSRLVCR